VAAGAGCQSSARDPVHANARVAPEHDLACRPMNSRFCRACRSRSCSTSEAAVVPPVGWQKEPLKTSDRHKHQVWLSPSGNTAYGVIRFTMPLPVGPDLALRHGILPEMRRTEGEATLISSQRDDRLPGLRFVAEGGKYRLRTNLMTRGWKGWAVYAGTLRENDVNPAELELAELARERTEINRKR
jgi:hypothetical protein